MPPLSPPSSKGGVSVVFGAAKSIILVTRLMTCTGEQDHQSEDWLFLNILRYNILKACHQRTTYKMKTIKKYFVRQMVLKVHRLAFKTNAVTAPGRSAAHTCLTGATRINKHKLHVAALTEIFFIVYLSYYVNNRCRFILRPNFVLRVLIFIFVFLTLSGWWDQGGFFIIITVFSLSAHSVCVLYV